MAITKPKKRIVKKPVAKKKKKPITVAKKVKKPKKKKIPGYYQDEYGHYHLDDRSKKQKKIQEGFSS